LFRQKTQDNEGIPPDQQRSANIQKASKTMIEPSDTIVTGGTKIQDNEGISPIKSIIRKVSEAAAKRREEEKLILASLYNSIRFSDRNTLDNDVNDHSEDSEDDYYSEDGYDSEYDYENDHNYEDDYEDDFYDLLQDQMTMKNTQKRNQQTKRGVLAHPPQHRIFYTTRGFDFTRDKPNPKTTKEMSKQEIRKMKTTLKKKIKVGENLTEHEMDLCEEWNIKY
jgi:hypothetical protein